MSSFSLWHTALPRKNVGTCKMKHVILYKAWRSVTHGIGKYSRIWSIFYWYTYTSKRVIPRSGVKQTTYSQSMCTNSAHLLWLKCLLDCREDLSPRQPMKSRKYFNFFKKLCIHKSEGLYCQCRMITSRQSLIISSCSPVSSTMSNGLQNRSTLGNERLVKINRAIEERKTVLN